MTGPAGHTIIKTSPFRELADQELAKQIADELVRHYPGHAWAVNVDHEQGIATIQILMLSEKMGFLLHLKGEHGDLAIPVVLRNAKMAGGEMLERFDIPRGRYEEGAYAGALAARGQRFPI